MSHEATVHQAQTIILRELLFVRSASYAVLQKATGLESDHFKFHIKRLVELGYVEKVADGYQLTSTGKEYANKLDTDNRTIERQPKPAVIMVISRDTADGQTVFLVQERLKHPYFGFWGFPGGKIRWGETILQAGARELSEETGLEAELTYRGVYHEHVIEQEGGQLLEDKLFHILSAHNPAGEMLASFDSGNNAWMTLQDVMAKEHRYASFDIEAEVGQGKRSFVEAVQYYSKQRF